MKITCQLLGGLGNMLFGLATTYAVSKDMKLVPCLNLDHRGYLHTPPTQYTKNIFRKFEIIKDTTNFYLYNEPSFRYTPINIPANVDVKLNGYFQCEKYFVKYRDEILELFSPSDDIIYYINNKYREFNLKECVAVHVRRGNYLHLSHIHPPCSLDYYYKSIEHFKNKIFLIFSDDINYCKQHFVGNKYKFIENELDIIDLYLMSMCSHNVISNSTFSWWGAWLNNNNTIIYPSKWFGTNKYDSTDIIPSSWITI